MAAFATVPIYRGVRFRRGMPELGARDCSQSECSLLCLDMRKLGYGRVSRWAPEYCGREAALCFFDCFDNKEWLQQAKR